MAAKNKQADIIPVKKEMGHNEPRHLLSPFDNIEKLFEDFFPRSMLRQFKSEWPSTNLLAAPFEYRMPKIDIVDRDDEIFVRAELPGIDKKDIEISMADYTLTIKGETKKQEKEEKGDYYRCETSQGSYMRTLSLPAEVNSDKAKSSFKDGVLELTLPKMERAKRRTIKVD